ncbi:MULTISPECIES: ester cyclase [Saccharothrix]|uniref:ester cyclase n=1 Tax=Saccharothrix TaxID=2071 RepID=UPI0009FB56DB|nr:ester cyclase [Saccharothrix sp. CB00851]
MRIFKGVLAAVVAGVLVTTAAPAATADTAPAAVDQHVPGAVAIGVFYAAFNTGRDELMYLAVTEDWVDDPAWPGLGTGYEAARQVVRQVRTVFPDLRTDILDYHVEGDRVTLSVRHSGTHSAEFAGVPATYRYVSFGAVETHRIRDDRIAYTWHWEDIDEFLEQVRG